MEILQQNSGQTLNIYIPNDFKLDLGREDNLKEYEGEVLRSVINPADNYETSRFIHKPYSGLTSNPNDLQSDIWFEFYFYRTNLPNPPTHVGGLDYSLVGISDSENAQMMKQSTKSFFRLEFYKTPNNAPPEKTNRRLVFARDLALPLGERIFHLIKNYPPIWDFLFVPIFVGSNFRNKENMYLFWFQDDSSFKAEPILTGNTFFLNARFFNADDGSILNFSNKSKGISDSVNENVDIYYEVVIDKTDNTYEVFEYNGSRGERIGKTGHPIRFYEIIGGDSGAPLPPQPPISFQHNAFDTPYITSYDACIQLEPNRNLYTQSGTVEDGVVVYSDSSLTAPFIGQGNGFLYKVQVNPNGTVYRNFTIDSTGHITATTFCPYKHNTCNVSYTTNAAACQSVPNVVYYTRNGNVESTSVIYTDLNLTIPFAGEDHGHYYKIQKYGSINGVGGNEYGTYSIDSTGHIITVTSC